eukprot:10813938-Ditylum_brightwellii.AAC.1
MQPWQIEGRWKTSAWPTEANKQLTSQIEKINDKLEVMTRLIKAIPTIRYNSGKGYGTGGRNNQEGGRNTNNSWQRFVPDSRNYCWSCGYNVGTRHNSITCHRPKDGHQKAAT